jgi:FG-GAP repeat
VARQEQCQSGRPTTTSAYASPSILPQATDCPIQSPISDERRAYWKAKVKLNQERDDGRAEIIASAAGENQHGMVHILRGSNTGWTSTGSSTLYLAGLPQYSTFGFTLAAGNFDGSGPTDLAVSAQVGGIVKIFKGSTTTVTTSGYKSISQSTSGVSGTDEPGDSFGESLAVGDVNGDHRDDLLVGSYGENEAAGRAVLLYGSTSGLTRSGSQSISQNTAGVPGTSDSADQFGRAVALADLNGDNRSDALMSAAGDSPTAEPAEPITLVPSAGGILSASATKTISCVEATGSSTCASEGQAGSTITG